MKTNAATRLVVIYEIVNTRNGHRYIGSSNRHTHRWKDHLNRLRKGLSESHFQRAYNKYGEKIFVFHILEKVRNPNKRYIREQYWIDKLNPEYNSKRIASGVEMTLEVRDKIRQKSKGRKNPWIAEHNRQPEVRARASKLFTGRKCPWSEGENSSSKRPEVRKKISDTLTGRPLSEEHKANILQGCRNSKKVAKSRRSKHTRKKRSLSAKKSWASGVYGTPEYRKKISDARKRWWKNHRKKSKV